MTPSPLERRPRLLPAAAAALSFLACGSTASPVRVVVPGAELISVSPDQAVITSHVSLTGPVGNVAVGDLLVNQLSPPLPQLLLDGAAFNSNFPSRKSSLLTYFNNATPSIDAGSSAVFGALWLWLPSFPAGVRLGSGFAQRTLFASDGSWIFFVDAPQPSRTMAASVAFVETAACTAARANPPPPGQGCPVHLLAQGQLVTSATASPDNRFIAWQENGGPGTAVSVHLLDTASLEVSVVSSSLSTVPLAFAPDGSLLALGTRPGQVISTRSRTLTGWTFPPGVAPAQLAFVNPQSLLVHGRDRVLYRTSASIADEILPMPVLEFSLPRSAALTSRYLFFSTVEAADGTNDARLLDLDMPATPGAVPVTLSQRTFGLPSASDDLGACAFLDEEDPAARTGILSAALLPGGSPVALGKAVHSWAFAEGSQKLVFIDPASEAFQLRLWRPTLPGSRILASSVLNWRVRRDPATIFFTEEGDTSGSIVAQPLP